MILPRRLRAGAHRFQFGQRGTVAVAIAVATLASLPGPSYGQTKDGLNVQLVAVSEGWEATDHVRHAFVSNDPFYGTGNPVGFPGQWHLGIQTSGAIFDSNVAGAWNRDLTGQGVTIGIVDDGLQHTHPDLNPNYVAADSFDFGQNDADPSPVFNNSAPAAGDGDNHGTAVAGVAAAKGGNGIGVTGAAPNANLAGLRIDFNNQTNQMFVNATLYHSSGANTNIKVKNHSYGVGIPYIPQTTQANAAVTSHNAGTIHVFAAGNERNAHFVSAVIDANNNGIFDPDIDPAIDADANKKHLLTLQETIDVAALGSSGLGATYSNWGSNIWVTAPSNSFRAGELSITTTDRTGGAAANGGYNNGAGGGDGDLFGDLNYTSQFGGTSSASPLVAGIMALGKQAQPNLNTRMAKHLLVRTSNVVDPLDASATGGWVTNGAGNEFNANYGFGVIDADEFTSQAVQFAGVTPLVTESLATRTVSRTIPDNNIGGISESFMLTGQLPLEEVEILLNITHPWRGDLEALLTSPMGTVSRLMYRNIADSFNNVNWTFLSNAFWGETPQGTWTLTVRDVFAGDVGTWNNFRVLAKMGSLVAVPEPSSLVLLAFGLLAFAPARRRSQSS